MSPSRLRAVGAAILAVSVLAEAAPWSEAATRAPSASSAATGIARSDNVASGTSASASEPSDDQIFYSLGLLLSQNLATFDLSEHEFQRVLSGFNYGYRHPAKTEDARDLIPLIHQVEHQRELMLIQHQKQAGASFLAKVAAMPGARKTRSGLVYVNVVPGTGQSPKPTDWVRIRYTGKLVDGTVFDSSSRPGAPTTFPLAGVIPCWREALQHIDVGGKARVVCPSDLAYGDLGRVPIIPQGATLDFQIELLAVIPGGAPRAVR
jgi:FKBP-type peptidyl-prolyl cis-trans isomerase FkpA